VRSVFSLAMLYLRASAHLEHFGRVADRHVLVIGGDAPLAVHDLGAPARQLGQHDAHVVRRMARGRRSRTRHEHGGCAGNGNAAQSSQRGHHGARGLSLLLNAQPLRNVLLLDAQSLGRRRLRASRCVPGQACGRDVRQAGAATTDDLIARTYAQTEMAFLEQALAKQRIYFGQYQQQNIAGPNMDMAADSITKLIDQMIGSPGSTWSWSVADWQANQETAIEEIATHLDNMFASMVAVPSEQAQQIQQAAAALPANSGTNIR